MKLSKIKLPQIKLSKAKIISYLLSLFIFSFLFLIIWYVVPDFLHLFFNTLLGKFILILFTVLLGFKDIKYGVGMAVLLIILYRFQSYKESFQNINIDPSLLTNTQQPTTWNQTTINNVLSTQNSNNPDVIYDTNILQQNATENEANSFLQNGYWPWSQKTQNNYQTKYNRNPVIRNIPQDSMKDDQQIYPEKTIKGMLALDSPEGKFVLSDIVINEPENKKNAWAEGVGLFGYTSGLINKAANKIIGCRKLNTDTSSQPYLIEPTEGAYSQVIQKGTKLNYSQLTSLITGFKFNKSPCNPCSLLDNPENNSCQFKIKTNL